jgi:hypothetical protein
MDVGYTSRTMYRIFTVYLHTLIVQNRIWDCTPYSITPHYRLLNIVGIPERTVVFPVKIVKFEQIRLDGLNQLDSW